jgi:polygalacturonase
VTLYLAPGAVLQASRDPKDFPLPFGLNHKTEENENFPVGPPGRDYGYDYALLCIHHAKNVAVKGAGILDAAGGSNGRLKIIHVQDSENITFQDITLRHGHGWMFPILHSKHIRVNNVKVISPITSNTDGLDPDSSTDVVIDGAFVVSGDDAIVLKSTNFGNRLRKTVRDVTVKNSTLLTVKSALKIGTETRSERYTNIVFDNNSIVTADRAFVIYLRDGALIENIYFTNNTVEGAGGIRDNNNRIFDIVISQRDRDVIWQHPDWSEKMRDNPGRIRNLLFENIAINTDGTHFLSESQIRGFDSANNIDRVAFRGITLNGEQVTDPEMIINFGENQSAQLLDIDYETVHNIWFNGERLDED